MAKINLLPWREQHRQQQKIQFIAALVVAVGIGLVAIVAVHMFETQRIEAQNERNQFLKERVSLLDQKIREINGLNKKKEDLIARMEIIQRLQSNRSFAVLLLDEIAKTIPDGVYLSSMTSDDKGSVKLDGVAESNSRISAFMRNLDGSEWLENPELGVINANNRNSKVERTFTLKVRAVNKKRQRELGNDA